MLALAWIATERHSERALRSQYYRIMKNKSFFVRVRWLMLLLFFRLVADLLSKHILNIMYRATAIKINNSMPEILNK